MAGIASTRIASGGGLFHKPQASDAKAADGTNGASPFGQMLDAAAPGTAASSAGDPKAQDKGGSGKSAPKNTKGDANASQVPQGAASQVIVAGGSQIPTPPAAVNDDHASTAKNDNTGAAGSNGVAGSANSDAAGTQQSPSSPQPATVDASQSLAAAQIPSSQDDIGSAQTAAPNGADVAAGIPLLPQSAPSAQSGPSTQSAPSTQSTPSTQSAPAAASGSQNMAAATGPTPDTTPITSSDTGSDTTSDTATKVAASGADPSQTAKAGKAKHDRAGLTSVQVQIEDATAQTAAAPQPDAPAPAAKKDTKPAKPQDQAGASAANDQSAPTDFVAAILTAPVQTQAPIGSADPNSANTVMAAGAAGPPKNSATSSSTDSTSPSGANAPAQKDPSSGNPPKADAAQTPQTSPTGAPTQDGFTAQNGDASQTSGNKPEASASDKSAKQAAAPVPAQAPQPQTAQSQPAQSQPAPSQTGVLSAAQPQLGPAGAPVPVTHNVQVSQADSNSTTNTIGALAVTIAAKSQSGNKQFDIRLDPPELGRVEVRLSIDATGKAEASLSADQPRTLDMLKTDAPVLARALRDAGLNVSQNGLNFSLRGQDRQNGGNSFTPRGARASQLSLVATSAIGSVAGGAHYQAPADGRLDIRV